MLASVWLVGVFINLVYAACPTPADIANGMKTATATTVTYTCDPGYVITSGNAVRTCIGSSWNGSLPTCTDMDELFSFTCDIEGTILAINPDPSTMIYVQANNIDGACTTTLNGNGTVTINGCDTDKEILLVFSPNSNGIHSAEIITTRVKLYNVTCLSIGYDGIHIFVTDDTWVQNLVSTTLQAPQTPNIEVDSEIFGFGATPVTGPPVAGVGDNSTYYGEVELHQQLSWRLFAPAPYFVKPLNCTAYSPVIPALGGRMSLLLVQDGCSVAPAYFKDFVYDDPPNKQSVRANLTAFKFVQSNTVEIVCMVLGCPPTSSECDFTCSSGKRRKRSEPSIYIEPKVDILEDDVDLDTDELQDLQGKPRYSAITTDSPNVSIRQGRVRFAFRVNGPPNLGMEYFSHSSRQETQKYGVLLSTLLSLLLCLLR